MNFLTTDTKLRAKLKHAREEAGLELREIAKALKIGYTTAYAWENGENAISEENLEHWADVTMVELSFFYEDMDILPHISMDLLPKTMRRQLALTRVKNSDIQEAINTILANTESSYTYITYAKREESHHEK